MKARVTVSAAVIMFLAASNTQAIASPAAGSAGGGGVAIGGHAGNTGGFGGASFGRSSFNAGTIGGGAGVSINSSYRGKSWGGGFGHGGGFRHGHWGGGWNNSYRNYGGSYRQFGNIGAGVYYPGVYPGGIIQYTQPVIQPPVAAQQRVDEARERDADIRRKGDERRQNLPTSAFVKNYDFSKKKTK